MVIREPALWRDIPVRGEVLDASTRGMGLAEAEVVDDDGRLIAHSTSRMRIFGDPTTGAAAWP